MRLIPVRPNVLQLLGSVLGAAAIVCCGASDRSGFDSARDGGTASGNGNSDSNDKTGGLGDAPGSAGTVESCAVANATRSCCSTGTQTCSSGTEFHVWGPCLDTAGKPFACDGTGGGGGEDGGAGTGGGGGEDAGGGTGGGGGEDAGGGTGGGGGEDAGGGTGGGGNECPCVVGETINCDEDCTQHVICRPFSTKVCQPDGRFGPCRESLVPTTNTGCSNFGFGCNPLKPDGNYIGNCGVKFACGHVP
jgi:hypothetical protein